MSDQLLRYYNAELAYLRKLGNEFAQAHESVAAQMGMGGQGQYDPHAERIVESVAFLTARIRQKLDDDFPEVSSAILDIFYPHYQRPFPSVSICKFALDESQIDVTSGHNIARHSLVETDPINGQRCRFRTCYPVTCWPMMVEDVTLQSRPFVAPLHPRASAAEAVLKIVLKSYSNEVPLAEMNVENLRFFINGQQPFNFQLHELILNHAVGISVAKSSQDAQAQLLGSEEIKLVGFGTEEGLVPYPAAALPGFRWLTEFFAFPDKFLFFDLQLNQVWKKISGNRAEIYIYLDRTLPEVESQVDRSTLQLGATPIVNLFQHRAEPFRARHFDFEYDVIPDTRTAGSYEIYSVDRVTGKGRQGQDFEFQPFYAYSHRRTANNENAFWHATRRKNYDTESGSQRGTHVSLSFVDLDFAPAHSKDWTIHIETTASNGDLPHHLTFGGGQPKVGLAAGGSLIKARLLTRPTKTLQPPVGKESRWRLISFLALNHLSLTDSSDGASALREMLSLHDFRDIATTQKMIAGLLSVKSVRTTGRVPGGVAGGLCRGLEVTLNFDETQYTGGGLFVLACVLEHFLGHYVSINSFTQTVATTSQRSGEFARWPPRAGDQILI